MFGDQFDQRRSDDHAIGHARDLAGLLGRAHTEADRPTACQRRGALLTPVWPGPTEAVVALIVLPNALSTPPAVS